MGIEKGTDLNGQRVTPNEDTDGGRNFTIRGRVQTDGGGSFYVADLGEDGLCALVSAGDVHDSYDIDDTEPVTDSLDERR